jgi:diguanylate cyclase (GGDEF)-like protein
MYLDRPAVRANDLELLRLFANQAAVAIRNSQLYEMATLDALTGVAVRRFFENCFERELRAAFRERRPLSMLLVDLDGMKQINDCGGHLAGDRALAAVGNVLRHAVRGDDIVGRYGGDEFAVVLPHGGRAECEEVAGRILGALSGCSVSGNGAILPVRASVGMATLAPASWDAATVPRPVPAPVFGEAMKTLMSEADASLYDAKSRRDGTPGVPGRAEWPPLAAVAAAAPAVPEVAAEAVLTPVLLHTTARAWQKANDAAAEAPLAAAAPLAS